MLILTVLSAKSNNMDIKGNVIWIITVSSFVVVVKVELSEICNYISVNIIGKWGEYWEFHMLAASCISSVETFIVAPIGNVT